MVAARRSSRIPSTLAPTSQGSSHNTGRQSPLELWEQKNAKKEGLITDYGCVFMQRLKDLYYTAWRDC